MDLESRSCLAAYLWLMVSRGCSLLPLLCHRDPPRTLWEVDMELISSYERRTKLLGWDWGRGRNISNSHLGRWRENEFWKCSVTAWRRQWHPTPELLPGESHGRRSLVAAVHLVATSQTWLSDFTFTFHFHTLEKEMATHSSILALRIPGTGEPGGLPSMGSHRVGHDWSDLAAAAATVWLLSNTEKGVPMTLDHRV